MTERSADPDAARAAALAGELRVVLGKLVRRLREHVQKGELTWSQTSAIGRLEREGPMTVTALARAEGVRPQSMGATVAALEAAGLVTGAPDPADGRQTILSLTDACRRWIEASRAAREDWLCRTLQARLSPAEQVELAASVELLKRLTDS
jgi:DNA-binding MarR family transcriptional regulator